MKKPPSTSTLTLAVAMTLCSSQASAQTFVKHLIASSGDPYPLAEDLDSDGDTDVVIGGDDGLEWFENVGGAFEAGVVFSPGHATHKAVADIDGDGDIDIAAADPYGGRLFWVENQGGTWGAETDVDDENDPTSIAFADLDGDSDLDLAATFEFDQDIVWYENDGGTFAPRQVLCQATLGWDNMRVSAADLDGDGDTDVMAATSAGLFLFENLGASFGPPVPLTTDWVESATAVDIDQDCDIDLLLATKVSAPWVALSEVQLYERNVNGFAPPYVLLAGNTLATAAVAVNTDLDGDLDVAVTSRDWEGDCNYDGPCAPGGLALVPGLGALFGLPILIDSVEPALYLSVVHADFNDDGRVDLLAGRGDGRLEWYENPGSPDSDRDGISDADEAILGTDPAMDDTDCDGVTDGDEHYLLGLDPLNPDTDGDGQPDNADANCHVQEPCAPVDEPTTDDTDPTDTAKGEPASQGHNRGRSGCGCASAIGSSGGPLLLVLLLLARRRD